MRRQQAYKHGRDQYASHLEGQAPMEKPSGVPDADNKGALDLERGHGVAGEKNSADSLEFQATAKAGVEQSAAVSHSVAAASEVDAILGGDEVNEADDWEPAVASGDGEEFEEDLEQQLEDELVHATMRVEHLQKTLHATKSMLQAPKVPIEPVKEGNVDDGDDDEDDEEDEEEEDLEEEEVESVSTQNNFGLQSQAANANPTRQQPVVAHNSAKYQDLAVC